MIEPFCGEDPATGSAASTLSAHLALQRGEGDATYTFSITQGMEMGRESKIRVVVTLDSRGESIEEVALAGSAVTLTEGRILI